MGDTMIDRLSRAVVVPVLTIESADHAVPLARALVRGGLTVLEVTLRTPVALEAISRIAAEVEHAVVGAGTILGPADLDRAAGAGAVFAVSPGLTPALLAPHDLPLLPGVATPTELMVGLEAGLAAFKFFPAVPMGGVPVMKALAGPFPQARFCPTGGVDQRNAAEFLALPNVLCVGGGWVAPKALIDAGRWDDITALAAAAVRLGATDAPG